VRRSLTSRTVQAAGTATPGCVSRERNATASEAFAVSQSLVTTAKPKIESTRPEYPPSYTAKCEQAFFTIPDLALRWHCSRATVYNVLRGEIVVDFAPRPGRKGHKLVSAEVVRQIENRRARKLT